MNSIRILIAALVASAMVCQAQIQNPPKLTGLRSAMTWTNGTSMDSPSNGVLRLGSGTNLSPVLTSVTLPPYPTVPILSVDPMTLTKSGSQIKVADWMKNNLLKLWYADAISSLISGTSFIDGPSYLFVDESGIQAGLSTNQVWNNPGYINQMSVATTNAPASLLVHYKMNDSNDTVEVTDAIGTHPATNAANTSTKTVSGKVNSALTYNGSSDYTIFEEIDTSGPISFSVWAKLTGGDSIVVGSDSDGYPLLLQATQNKVVVANYLDTDTTWFTGLTIDGNWHHYVVTCTNESSRPNLWLDGVSVPYYLEGQPGVAPIRLLGARRSTPDGSESAFFTGQIDDFRFYRAILTSNEIAALYNAGAGTEGYSGSTISVPAPMFLTMTNKVVDFVASNQFFSWIAQSTNSPAELTNNQLPYAVSLDGTLTNWGAKPTLVDSTDVSNLLFTAARTNFTFWSATNNMGVYVSSNVSVIIKGMAAPCAP